MGTVTGEAQPTRSRPPFWVRLSIPAGNFLQLAGLIIGAGVIHLAGHSDNDGGALVRVLLMLLGSFVIYISGHSLAHWTVGRLVGIRFRGYGVRGTDHPEELGAFMRSVMSRVPMFTVMTEKTSMETASPIAKALMFAAGETSTILGVIVCALVAWQNQIPGGLIWLIVALAMSVIAVTSTSSMPAGDYAKARKALRGNSP